NTIDAVGDQAITEADVFEGVEEAMKDIRGLINRLVNNLSVANILVTADYGFIYLRDRLEISQLTRKQVKGNFLESRRFILSEEKVEQEGTFSYQLDEMIQDEQMKYVTVPKGINRFQVQG